MIFGLNVRWRKKIKKKNLSEKKKKKFWTSFDDKVTGYLLTRQPFCYMAYSAYFEV